MRKYQIVPIRMLGSHIHNGSAVESSQLSSQQTLHVPALEAQDPIDTSSDARADASSLEDKGYDIRVSPITLHIIDGDIAVRGPLGILTVDNIAIKESLYYDNPSKMYEAVESQKQGRIERDGAKEYYIPVETKEVVRVSKPCLRATGGFAPKRVYGHFWMDHIGHFGAWHEFRSQIPSDCCALFPALSNSLWEESLLIIAEKRSQPLTLLPIHYNQEIRVNRLYYLEGISPNYVKRPRPEFFHYTRALAARARLRLTRSQINTVRGIGRKVFISRRDDSLRAAGEVDSVLESEFGKRGYSVIHPRQLSVSEQLTIYSRAEVIAGRWGSGHDNMLFAPEKAILADIQSPFNVSNTFRDVVCCGGQRYTRMIGKPSASTTTSSGPSTEWEVTRNGIQNFINHIESKL